MAWVSSLPHSQQADLSVAMTFWSFGYFKNSDSTEANAFFARLAEKREEFRQIYGERGAPNNPKG